MALLALALTAQGATAQGFGVYEHDACTMARAGAGVAKPCNASAIFYNPAGMVMPGGATRNSVSFGVTNIAPSFAFADSVSSTTTNSVSNNIPVPQFFLTRQGQLNGRNWAYGIGVFAPYGLVSEWPNTFSGRFLGFRSELKSVYIQPTVALQVNSWLSLGAGFDYIWTHVDLKQRVDLSSQVAAGTTTFGQLGIPTGTDFAEVNLIGNAYNASGHFGVIVKPTSKLSLGARYLLRANGNVQGDANFTQVMTGIILPAGNPLGAPAGTPLDTVLAPQFRVGGKLIGQHASTSVPLPDQLVLGASYEVTPELTALFDWQWVNWSQFQSLIINTQQLPQTTQYEDYNNTSGYRFGLQYEMSGISLRGGYLFHEGAAPDQTVTPLLPEGRRQEFTLGAGIKVGANGHLDAAYQHITQQDRRGRVVPAPRYSTAFNTGLYTGSASLIGVSLTWGF